MGQVVSLPSTHQPDRITRFTRWWESADKETQKQIREIVTPPVCHMADAEEVLEHLNRTRQSINPRCRGYKPSKSGSLKYILHRLNEGYTVAECRAVVAMLARKVRADAHEFQWLNPETVFYPTKFAKYYGELET